MRLELGQVEDLGQGAPAVGPVERDICGQVHELAVPPEHRLRLVALGGGQAAQVWAQADWAAVAPRRHEPGILLAEHVALAYPPIVEHIAGARPGGPGDRAGLRAPGLWVERRV